MSDKNEVFEVIKSVITSQKGGVLLKDINRDYKDLVGEHIPYKRFGYHSIEEVLDDIPEVRSHVNDDGQVVFINKGKNCEHLVELISKQKSTKNNKFKVSSKGVRQKQGKHRKPEVGELVNERNKCSQENDNNTLCMVKRMVGERTYSGEKKCKNSADQIHNMSLKQKNGPHTRKSEAYFCTHFDGQRDREEKPNEMCFDESFQLEHWHGHYDSSLEYRTYLYKSSKLLDRRDASHFVYKHDPRDLGRSRKFEATQPFFDDCAITNWHSPSVNCNRGEKYASSSTPKSFKTVKTNLLEDYPCTSYRGEDFGSPIVRSHHRYSKNPKYEAYRGSRYVPEIDDWNRIFFLGRRHIPQ